MVKTKAQPGPSKVSLNIISELQNGFSVPVELKYGEDTFEVKNPVRSTKVIRGGIRWRCSVDGRDIELFNNGDAWWMEQ